MIGHDLTMLSVFCGGFLVGVAWTAIVVGINAHRVHIANLERERSR